MTRLFANHGEAERSAAVGKPPLRVHFSNSPQTVGQHLKWPLPQHSAALSTAVVSIFGGTDCCLQRERPNRSYLHVPPRPDERWRSSQMN